MQHNRPSPNKVAESLFVGLLIGTRHLPVFLPYLLGKERGQSNEENCFSIGRTGSEVIFSRTWRVQIGTV